MCLKYKPQLASSRGYKIFQAMNYILLSVRLELTTELSYNETISGTLARAGRGWRGGGIILHSWSTGRVTLHSYRGQGEGGGERSGWVPSRHNFSSKRFYHREQDDGCERSSDQDHSVRMTQWLNSLTPITGITPWTTSKEPGTILVNCLPDRGRGPL